MNGSSRTRNALIVLGVVGAGVAGYFVWSFLAPGVTVEPIQRAVSTQVEAGTVSSPAFTGLRSFANLPVAPGPVGRTDPFAPLPVINANDNVNANTNANTNTNLIR